MLFHSAENRDQLPRPAHCPGDQHLSISGAAGLGAGGSLFFEPGRAGGLRTGQKPELGQLRAGPEAQGALGEKARQPQGPS